VKGRALYTLGQTLKWAREGLRPTSSRPGTEVQPK
jgi:hypothetical protein